MIFRDLSSEKPASELAIIFECDCARNQSAGSSTLDLLIVASIVSTRVEKNRYKGALGLQPSIKTGPLLDSI